MNEKKHILPEILAPAGNREQLEAAVLYGADAVYLGGVASLRASRSFTSEALAHARTITRRAGVSLYFCCNAFPRQHSWRHVMQHLEEGAKAEADAFIIADAGVVRMAQQHFSHIPIHLSTQANTCNAGSALFWQEQGISRVNLARELRLTEIRAIRKACPDLELECFVHGAQCLAISGQCLLSAWLNNRPANAGQCTQPCRFTYRPIPGHSMPVEEALRQGQTLWDVTQGEEGFSAFWAPEDLCLLAFVPWFARQGIQALKIEGRMRTGAYVAHVVDVYRQVLKFTRLTHTVATQVSKQTVLREMLPKFLQELSLWTARPLGTGFFVPRHKNVSSAPLRDSSGHSPILARLEEEKSSGVWRVNVRGMWQSNQDIQFVLPGGQRPRLKAQDYALENHRKMTADCVHSGTEATLHMTQSAIAGLCAGIYVELCVE